MKAKASSIPAWAACGGNNQASEDSKRKTAAVALAFKYALPVDGRNAPPVDSEGLLPSPLPAQAT